MSSLPDNAPSPRLCHIAQWPDFQGYGFNLHAEKSKPGQFIGKIDNNSPAEVAGLKEGDRIIEVNGVNIGNENHKQVVSRIKAEPKETKLLVVDPETDKWYKAKNIVVSGEQSNVIYRSSSRDAAAPPPPEIATNGHHHEEADTRSVSSHASSSAASEASTQPQSPMSTSPTPPPSLDTTSSKTPEPVSTPTPEPEPITTTTTTTTLNNATHTNKQPLANRNSFNASGLNLNMSAAEMRAHLASRKKTDPRKETIDLKKKYEIIQNM